MAEVFDATENDNLVAELAAEWSEAPEPGSSKVGKLEHRGDDEVPAPMVQSQLSSAGYVYVWNRQTGDRSLVNRNMLPAQMKKRFIDGPMVGQLAFSRTDPRLDPKFKATKRNRLKCRLHVEDPDRDEWDEMGFPLCTKSNLVSEFHRGRHMRSKHKDEWAAIQDLEYRREDENQKEFQRMLMQQAVRAGVPIGAVTETPKRRQKNPNRVAAGKRTAAKLGAASV